MSDTSSATQRDDRAAGALLGGAVGDALGVPYEYGSRPLPGPDRDPEILGGGLGGYAPGQWSDDTEMACVLSRVAATGADLRTEQALDAIADGFLEWFAADPPDAGVQTRRVLSGLVPGPGSAQRMRQRATQVHGDTGRSGGNGSLMRTAPVALAHLGDPDAITDAARAVSALTHHDPAAADACVLWCLAVDHAVATGELDLRVGLHRVDGAWADLITAAEHAEPSGWAGNNGWVVAALQGAWSAIRCGDGFAGGVVAAVRGGGDTDTVAAIAGSLLGAAHGAAAISQPWRAAVHGWPGLRGADLVELAHRAVRSSRCGRPYP